MKESWDCTTGHLLTTIAELQRELEGYRQALEKYGTHRSGCTWWKAYSNKPECSCGFVRVLAGKEGQGEAH